MRTLILLVPLVLQAKDVEGYTGFCFINNLKWEKIEITALSDWFKSVNFDHKTKYFSSCFQASLWNPDLTTRDSVHDIFDLNWKTHCCKSLFVRPDVLPVICCVCKEFWSFGIGQGEIVRTGQIFCVVDILFNGNNLSIVILSFWVIFVTFFNPKLCSVSSGHFNCVWHYDTDDEGLFGGDKRKCQVERHPSDTETHEIPMTINSCVEDGIWNWVPSVIIQLPSENKGQGHTMTGTIVIILYVPQIYGALVIQSMCSKVLQLDFLPTLSAGKMNVKIRIWPGEKKIWYPKRPFQVQDPILSKIPCGTTSKVLQK